MIVLQWNQINDISKYFIYRSDYPEKEFEKIGEAKYFDTIYIDENVEKDRYYYYYIVAVKNGVMSNNSNIVKMIDNSNLPDLCVRGEFYNKFYYNLINELPSIYNKETNVVPYSPSKKTLILFSDTADGLTEIYLNNRLQSTIRYNGDGNYVYTKAKLSYGENIIELKKNRQTIKTCYIRTSNLNLWLEAFSKILVDLDEQVLLMKADKFIDQARYSKIYDNFGHLVNVTQQFNWTNFRYKEVIKGLLQSYLKGSTAEGIKKTIQILTGKEPDIVENYLSNELDKAKEENDIEIINPGFTDEQEFNGWSCSREADVDVKDYVDFANSISKDNVDLETDPGKVMLQKELLLKDTFDTTLDNWNLIGSKSGCLTISDNKVVVSETVAETTLEWGNPALYSKQAFNLYKYPIILDMVVKQTSGICIYGISTSNTGGPSAYQNIAFGFYFSSSEDGYKIKIKEFKKPYNLIETGYTWSPGKYYQLRIETLFNDNSNVGQNGAIYRLRSAVTKSELNGQPWTLVYTTTSYGNLTSDYNVYITPVFEYSAPTEVDDVYVYKANSYLYSSVIIDSQNDWQSSTGNIERVSSSNIDFITNSGKIQLNKTTPENKAAPSYGGICQKYERGNVETSYAAFDGSLSTWVEFPYTRNYDPGFKADDIGVGRGVQRIWLIKRFVSGVTINCNLRVYWQQELNIKPYVYFLDDNDNWRFICSGDTITTAGIYYWWNDENKIRSITFPSKYTKGIRVDFIVVEPLHGGSNTLKVNEVSIIACEYYSLGSVIYKLTQPQTISSDDVGYFEKSDTSNGEVVEYSIRYSNDPDKSWGSNSPDFNDGNFTSVSFPFYHLEAAQYAQLKIELFSYNGDTPVIDMIKIGYFRKGNITNRLSLDLVPVTIGKFSYSLAEEPINTIVTFLHRYSDDNVNYSPSNGESIENLSNLTPHRYHEITAILRTENVKKTPILDSYSIHYDPSTFNNEGIYLDSDGALTNNSARITEYGFNKTLYQKLEVEQNTPYELSAFIKSDIDEDNNAKLIVRHADKDYILAQKTITASADWVRYRLPFMIFEPMTIKIELAKNTSTEGSVWFDDIRIDRHEYMFNSNAQILIYNSEVYVNDEVVLKGPEFGTDSLANQYIFPVFDKSGIQKIRDEDGNIYQENVDFTVDYDEGKITWYVLSQTATEILDQDFNEVHRTSQYDLLSTISNFEKLAQSFKVSNNGRCGKVKLYLKRNGSFTGSVYITINEDDNGHPGTILATSKDVNCMNISVSNWDWIEFSFDSSNMPILTTEKIYYLVLNGTYTISSSNYILWGIATGSSGSYANGYLESYSNNSWTIESGYDGIFKVYSYADLLGTQPETGKMYYVTYSYIPKDFYQNVLDKVKPAHVKLKPVYYLSDGKSEETHRYGKFDESEWDESGWK